MKWRTVWGSAVNRIDNDLIQVAMGKFFMKKKRIGLLEVKILQGVPKKIVFRNLVLF